MEPIDLMRCETGDFFRGDPDSEKWRGEAVTWFKALTRAEYDALVARLHVAEQQADALVGDRGDLLARAEKAEAQRDAYISGREMQRERANAATARAEKAEARIASIERVASEQYAALRGRAERAEALLAKTIPCVKFYNENQSPPGLELNLLDEIEKLIKETT